MIKTIEKASEVQRRRVAAGKKGHAKAVRRFMLRTYRETGDEDFAPWTGYDMLGMPADFTGCGPYVPNKGAKL